MRSLKSSIISGTKWTSVNTLVARLINFLSKIVLAWLLTPHDFGVASATVITCSLLLTTSDLGMKKYLIQLKFRPGLLKDFNVVFWGLFIISILFVFVSTTVISPFVASYLNTDELLYTLSISSFSIIFYSINIVPEVIALRRLRYKVLALIDLSSMCITICFVALLYIFYNPNYWLLIALNILPQINKCILLISYTKYRPGSQFQIWAFHHHLKESLAFLGNQLIFYLRSNIDKIVVGKLLGMEALGVYNLAFSIIEELRSQFSRVMVQIMSPLFGRSQSDAKKIESYYQRVRYISIIILIPFSILLFSFAEIGVSRFMKSEWSALPILIQVLLFSNIIYAFSGPSSELLIGIGEARKVLRLSILITLTLAIPMTILLAYYAGLLGATLAFVISFSILRIATLRLMYQVLDQPNHNYQTLLAIQISIIVSCLAFLQYNETLIVEIFTISFAFSAILILEQYWRQINAE